MNLRTTHPLLTSRHSCSILFLFLIISSVLPELAGAQSWMSAPSLLVKRENVASTTGPDGKIYAFGGSALFLASKGVQAYDPSTSKWTVVASLNTARFGPAAATSPDGKVYAIGGAATSGDRPFPITTVEAYDPTTNTWSTVASLNTARYDVAAATGPDGKIYAIGGNGSNSTASAAVEAYDPTANTWTTVASLNTPRADLTATTGPDGKIYAIGGVGESVVLSSVEAYDTSLNTWTTVASLNTARSILAAATGSDGKVYAIGGAISGLIPSSVVEAYDPAANTWTPVASLNSAREALAAATGPDGKLYAIGGSTGGDGSNPSTIVEVYDPGWFDVAPLNTARAGPAAATGLDGTLYALGGEDNLGNVFNLVEAYDPATNAWTSLPALNTARAGLAAATGVDGKVYAIGGADSSGDVLGSVEAYDPTLNAWNFVASLNTARADLAAATGPDGKLYAIGGIDSSTHVSSVVEAYDPTANTWTAVASLNVARAGLAAATGVDGKVYAIGGIDSSGDVFSSVEAYDPTTNTWTLVASLNIARELLAATAGPDGKLYAMGGSEDGINASHVVEAYDPTANTWASVTSLLTPSLYLAATTGLTGKLYAIGGLNSGTAMSEVQSRFIEILPQSLTIHSGATSTITVTLGAPAPVTGLLLALSSSDPSAASLPSFLFIAPGNTGGSAPITLGSATDSDVTLSATYQGKTVSGSLPVNVTPSLAFLFPTPVIAGGANLTLYVTGSGFVPGSQVTVNGSPRPTTYVISSQLTAQISADDIVDPGTAQIQVINPILGGSSSNTLPLTINPRPTLSAASPDPITAGGPDFALTVTGTGFVAGAQVLWAGRLRSTVYLSPTQLTATILATDILKAGMQSVVVRNPSEIGGGKSNLIDVSVVSALLHQVGHQALRNTDGSVSVTVELDNEGTTDASNTQLTSATLGSVSGTPVPQSLGTIEVGQTTSVTTTYTNPGPKGTKLTLTLSGTFTQGSWKSSLSVTLP